MGLVHHVGRYEPIVPGLRLRKGLTVDPALVLGESEAMARVLEQLRTAVDVPVPVLLRGEPGTGRQLLARTLHLSGSRRDGPFVVASCGGADPQRIEADLFGAVVPGKSGPVERQGKLLLADGGTLYLHDVAQLPLELQARLVRFLRTGEVEPAGSVEARKVDVRIVASSTGPLEPEVARDRLRVDLAHRLSGLAVDVPPLRQRREDLPLLIQTYINRCCHEAGKRVQGVSVKAMGALVGYHYPGNLIELENLTRQLVYLCPNGQPIDVNLLPSKLTSAELQAAARVDAATSELRLDALVASCEQAAIQEALRRSHHNKSEAARLLGLSRNGLALKMERHGL
jgi:DNA-binding NtrC family response regulator